MAEQNNQNTGSENNQQERTFTQAELDRIVQSRVADETKKYAEYKEKAEKYDAQLESEKSELQKATERGDALQRQLDEINKAENGRRLREKVSKATGVPANLLIGEDEETLKEQADAILKFAKPNSYPGTKANNKRTTSNSGDDDMYREFAREIFNSKGEK